MVLGALINLASSVAQSVFHHSGSEPVSSTPFAQILGSLEQVHQSSPAQYKTMTQQISAKLASEARSASASGNAAIAGQLSRLSADFTVASNNGQLPDVTDLAQAVATLSSAHIPLR